MKMNDFFKKKDKSSNHGGISRSSDSSVLDMVYIPSGVFWMGSDINISIEKPMHPVVLSLFYMSIYPVNWARWIEVKKWGENNGYEFRNKENMGGGNVSVNQNHPVTGIPWHDPIKWCNALSEKEGKIPCYYTSPARDEVYRKGRLVLENDWVNWDANGYRLPTEAEWEYACRAGTTTRYHYGDTLTNNDANICGEGTTPVGSYKPNAWGLYDMHGNVWEWCWDRVYKNYGKKGPVINPRICSEDPIRCLRGGSWSDKEIETVRSSCRGADMPGWGTGQRHYGFRVVCSPNESEDLSALLDQIPPKPVETDYIKPVEPDSENEKKRIPTNDFGFTYFKGPAEDMSDMQEGKHTCDLCGAKGVCFSLEFASVPELGGTVKKVDKVGCIDCLKAGRFEFWHDTEIGSLDETGFNIQYNHQYPSPKEFDQEKLIELRRTPQIVTWQQEIWLTHCDDFMLYQGTWNPVDFYENAPDGDGRKLFMSMTDNYNNIWDDCLQEGESKLEDWYIVYYVFKCRHCGKLRGNWDCD